MKKMMELVPPRAGMALQAFHDHWRHPHGTVAIAFHKNRKYIQNHRIESALVGPNATPFEGVMEVWFDNWKTIDNIGSLPTVRDFFYPDEERFIDRAGSVIFKAEEEVLTIPDHDGLCDDIWTDRNRPISIKLFQVVRAEGSEPWAGPGDAELAFRLGAFRCVRSHVVDGTDALVGVRELCWPTLTRFEEGVASDPDAWARWRDGPADAFMLLTHSERLI